MNVNKITTQFIYWIFGMLLEKVPRSNRWVIRNRFSRRSPTAGTLSLKSFPLCRHRRLCCPSLEKKGGREREFNPLLFFICVSRTFPFLVPGTSALKPKSRDEFPEGKVRAYGEVKKTWPTVHWIHINSIISFLILYLID